MKIVIIIKNYLYFCNYKPDSMDISTFETPIFVVDSQTLKRNIIRIKDKLGKNTVFRPHFKTHINADVGKIFKDYGINQITVSSVDMAEFFYKNGFRDITIAFPFNIRQLKRTQSLAEKTSLNLCISNPESAIFVSENFKTEVGIFVEIDTGDNRSGIDWNNQNEISQSIRKIITNQNLIFKGFLTHNGQTYRLNSPQEIIDSSNDSIAKMMTLKEKYSAYKPIISIGDTPGACLLNDFTCVDEVRPGNFVYFDLMQLNLGVCEFSDISARIYCPVVDINSDRNQIVIYGGAIHFSKDFIMYEDQKSFGLCTGVLRNQDKIQLNANLISLSQEHGIIQFYDEFLHKKSIIPGDIVEIIPVHSCLTAHQMQGSTLLF
jgi:D-serine deaminase-like pyridoxal phosphate-dependent protein